MIRLKTLWQPLPKQLPSREVAFDDHGNGDTRCTLALAAPHSTVQASLPLLESKGDGGL